MGLLFCCPSCGAELRVNPAQAVLVSCPGCGEPVRVPRRPHPREAATDTPPFPADIRTRLSAGLSLLTASLWAFAAAGVSLAAAFLLRVAVGPHPADGFPNWLPAVQLSLAGWWLLTGTAGCLCRVTGYLRCRLDADRFALRPWATAAAAGATLALVGVLAVVPAIVGRPVLDVPVAGSGLILIGMSAGSLGVLLEFAFLPVLHRVLWEAAGWHAANQTSRFVVAFVFGMVAVMAALCLGVMALVLTAGPGDGPDDVSPHAKGIALVVIVAVGVISGWMAWRFGRLLRLTRSAVDHPEPSHNPSVSSG